MTSPTQRLADTAAELLAAIDRRWENESARKRENAISPRQEEAMTALREALTALANENGTPQ